MTELGSTGSAGDRRRAGTRPVRERVTSVDAASARTEPPPRTGRWAVGEAETLFTRSLMRAHGRLAIMCLVSFAIALVLVTVVMSRIPLLDEIALGGVPLTWLIHAYGFYPLMIVWAVGYTLACQRLEGRFTQLVEPE
ncbi:hypothetical protein [Yonghaparkia sp. Soil809]|uniref:hypothetical protein n=1 Tax=Yonghaparkia sp. Soil809 TaxID=1736417 RepID=UPI0006F6CBC5|nr:hypothetical protein [Yonghaparkia sp. Soil809]KRF32639.1 hypothetical protein ASG83_00840 [Yonghaparkia sp. Soil809]